MGRQVFLTTTSVIAFGIGLFAIVFPDPLLESKGVAPLAGTLVWTRKTGLLLTVVGIIAFRVRKHEASDTLKVFLFGNIVIQAGLFLIELRACFDGIITQPSGIIPNLILHILLGSGFIYFRATMQPNNNR